MPRITPVAERLRDTCLETIDQLVLTGKVQSVKDATKLVYSTCMKQHKHTGFRMDSWEHFYWCVEQWYRKRSKSKMVNERYKEAVD